MKLNVKALAITSGLLWGIGLFGMTWWLIAFEGISDDPTWIGLFYRGYTISPMGSMIGLIWSIPDGFIGGAIFAWVYNLIVVRVTNQ